MKTKLLINTLIASTFFVGIANARPGNGEQGGNRPNPEEMVAQLIVDHDLDETNTLDAAELEQALISMHAKRMERQQKMAKEGKGNGKERPSEEEMSAKLIEEFDADADGMLNSEELMQALKEMGPRHKRK